MKLFSTKVLTNKIIVVPLHCNQKQNGYKRSLRQLYLSRLLFPFYSFSSTGCYLGSVKQKRAIKAIRNVSAPFGTRQKQLKRYSEIACRFFDANLLLLKPKECRRR